MFGLRSYCGSRRSSREEDVKPPREVAEVPQEEVKRAALSRTSLLRLPIIEPHIGDRDYDSMERNRRLEANIPATAAVFIPLLLVTFLPALIRSRARPATYARCRVDQADFMEQTPTFGVSCVPRSSSAIFAPR